MKDSARTQQDESTSPVARPTWRFSGRRGTPVHQREQAPQTLPPEIRKAVTQLARERAGESAPAADARPVRTSSELKLGRQDHRTPPVAAAPMPVERRNRDVAEPAVPTSHIPAATAPTEEPTLETVALEPSTAVDMPDAPASPAVATVATDAPVAADATKREESSKLTTAERKKVAKAKAKARAKAQRSAKKEPEGEAAADRSRRLFARGRDVAADAAAVVEPAVQPTVEPTAAPAPAAKAPAIDAPPPPDVGDLPDVIPSIDAIDETEPASFPSIEPGVTGEAVDAEMTMEPALAIETAAQAAWELGRLPFLLRDPGPPTPEPVEARPTAIRDTTPAVIDAAPSVDVAAPSLERTLDSSEPTQQRPQRASLQPIDWLPVGTRPTPAPIEPVDMPRRAAPDAIQRLGAPLELPRDDRARARASTREGMTAIARTTEARRRISRRRAELDELVTSLAGLGSGRRDS